MEPKVTVEGGSGNPYVWGPFEKEAMSILTSLAALPTPQDTTVVALARDGYALFTAWAVVGAGLALVALLAAVLLVLAELRRLSAALTDFLATVATRSQALVNHASGAARNVEQITATVRSEVERVSASLGGLTDGIEEASGQLQRRLKDLLALAEVAQSEAEEAVLEAGAGLRALRSNAAGILRIARRARDGSGREGEQAGE